MSFDRLTERKIDQFGETVTLRRVTGTGANQAPFEVGLKAFVRKYDPDQLVGALQQGDRNVIIGNRPILAAQWPGPPVEGDKIIIDGKTTTIQEVETVRVGDIIVRFNIRTRG